MLYIFNPLQPERQYDICLFSFKTLVQKKKIQRRGKKKFLSCHLVSQQGKEREKKDHLRNLSSICNRSATLQGCEDKTGCLLGITWKLSSECGAVGSAAKAKRKSPPAWRKAIKISGYAFSEVQYMNKFHFIFAFMYIITINPVPLKGPILYKIHCMSMFSHNILSF